MSWGQVAQFVAPAVIGGAGQIFGAKKAASSNDKATQIQAKAAADALEQEKLAMAEDRRRYDEQQAALKAQWDAREQQRAPFRAAALEVLRRSGYPVSEAAGPSSMPPGWDPNAAQTRAPRTLSSMASMYAPPEAMQTPKLTLTDVLNNNWAARAS